jgi:hypothetical protein
LGAGSRSKLSRIRDIAMCVDTQLISEADVLEMGISKAQLILPIVRDGGLTDELLSVAIHESERGLREYLGHKVPDWDHGFTIDCPMCGYTIEGVKRVKGDKVGIQIT